MKVWKIGSRWNKNGNPNASIIDIFRRNQIVFVGDTTKTELYNIKDDDIIAIANGTKIISIAHPIGKAFELSKENCNEYIHIEPWDKFSHIDFINAIAIKVRILDISNPIKYVRTPTVCRIHNNSVLSAINNANNTQKQFDIRTSVYRLFDTRNDSTKLTLLSSSKATYVIPIYQRPYSWGEMQIERFINDLFRGYWGDDEDKTIKKLPMFIGNMQLSSKYFISDEEWKQDVIDGQQRITTMLLILKYLYISYPSIFKKHTLKIEHNFLCTHVSGEENKLHFINQLDNLDVDDSSVTNNQYYSNLLLIKKNIETIIKENNSIQFNPFDFLEYILNDIYFVVVETEATLSETINIFNTINTAGMDLNSGDLFKLRMSEYLVYKRKSLSIEDAFQQVDLLYKKIDDLNLVRHKKYSILTILANYQDYIITKEILPKSLYRLGTERFFEQLFDCLLNIKTWEHFTKAKNISLELKDLLDFIEIQYDWDTHIPTDSEDMFARNIIKKSRYADYQNLSYLILKRYQNNYNYVYDYLKYISKLFIINSLYYEKKVNLMHTFMYELRNDILFSDFKIVISKIIKKIESSRIDELYQKYKIKDVIEGYIADSDMRKNLLCRISEYLIEKQKNVPINEMYELLFNTEYDIEHIHANADSTIKVTDGCQNSIGNLVLLERKINRSIQDDTFTQKKVGYKNSKYYSICDIRKNEKWDEDEIRERMNQEVARIMAYLFDTSIAI